MGFKDRIRIYSLLMEGLRVLRDIPQKNCRAVAYSHGGHLLAVASGFSLFVYTAITAQQVGCVVHPGRLELRQHSVCGLGGIAFSPLAFSPVAFVSRLVCPILGGTCWLCLAILLKIVACVQLPKCSSSRPFHHVREARRNETVAA